MSAVATYTVLRRLGARVLTTGEASAALRTSQSAASRSLGNLAAMGLAQKVRFGLWLVGDEPIDPRALVGDLTRPFPAYVSFVSALAAHGAIDQIPRDITVASLAKPHRIETSFGTYAVHRLPPELFGGFSETDGLALATVEKAIFDYFYVACASGHPGRRLPELDLAAAFSEKELALWTARINSARLRTLVTRDLKRSLEHAEREERRPRPRIRRGPNASAQHNRAQPSATPPVASVAGSEVAPGRPHLLAGASVVPPHSRSSRERGAQRITR